MKKLIFVISMLSALCRLYSQAGMEAELGFIPNPKNGEVKALSEACLDSTYFYALPFYRKALIEKNLGFLSIKEYGNFFLPKCTFSAKSSLEGDYEEGMKSFSSQPAFDFIQKLPGACSLGASLSGNIYLSLSDEIDFCYRCIPSVSLSVPLAGSRKFISIYNFYGRNNYASRKKSLDLQFDIAVRDGIYKYVSEVGNYLYYRRISELYSEKYELLERQTEDYESLFNMGKVTAVNVSDKISEKMQFFQSVVEVNRNIITSEKALAEMGIRKEEISFSLEDFISSCRQNFLISGPVYYRDYREISYLDVELLDYVESVAGSLPYVTAGFSMVSPVSDYDFPDFSEGTWAFSLSLTIPFYGRSGGNLIKSVSEFSHLTGLEKERLTRRHLSSDAERKGFLELYETYRISMEKTAMLETERLSEYENLYRIGRISEYDLKMQQNTAALSRLYNDYAELKLILTELSFY